MPVAPRVAAAAGPAPAPSLLTPWAGRRRDPGAQVVKLKAFKKFENTADALASAAALVDSKMSKTLKKCARRRRRPASRTRPAARAAVAAALVTGPPHRPLLPRCPRRRLRRLHLPPPT